MIPLIVGLCACGNQPAGTMSSPSSPPNANSILARVDKLHDAHFAYAEQLPDGTRGTGEGLVVFRPLPAERYTVTIADLGLTFETIFVGDAMYYRKTTDQAYKQARARSDLGNLSSAYDLAMKGEEQTPQGKAWHLSGTNIYDDPFEIWIREKDGYPIKYSTHGDKIGSEDLNFDRYNTGQSILPPAASQLVQG